MQNKAQDICLAKYGNKPLKGVNAIEAIDELKDYYNLNRDGNQKLVAILQVKGAAAWIIHNAIKRNYDKHRKGSNSSSVSDLTHTQSANKSQTSTPKDDGSAGNPV